MMRVAFALLALPAVLGFAPKMRTRRGAAGLYMGGAAGESTTLEGKKKTVAAVLEKLEDSTMIFSVKGDGLTVAEMTQLRTSLPEGTTCKVVKNRLMKRALGDHPKFDHVDDLLETSNLWFFCGEDDMKASMKVLDDFLKEADKEESHAIRGGAMEGEFLDAKGVKAVAKMPSKKELITRIAVGIKGVPQRLAKRVKAVPSKMARAVKLANDEIHGEAAPAEE
mmetsp:Transcript_16762/g.51498  ORF Transcript_16762/g.51498 Transcript_16762/m.51498 type:complete len:223 (-) Transcript_16762:425-1093(-)